MKSKVYKDKLNDLIWEIEQLIEKMPYKGDSENESQKVCLTNRLNEFYYSVNGIEDEDFILNDVY